MVITIFYQQSNWHTLLRFIHPHLKRCAERRVLDWYCIELASRQGDYVRLIICSSGNREELTRFFSKKIKHYLDSHPSDRVEDVYPLSGYFMNYPNNTVWIDHNRLFKFVYAYEGLGEVHMQISRILMTASEDEEITLESICTIFVYMQLGMISAFCPDIGQAEKMAKMLASAEKSISAPDSEGIEQTDTVDNLFGQLLKENLEVLVEMVNNVWEQRDSESEWSWITGWENVVKKFVGNSDMHSALFKLNGLIYKQMAFVENARIPMLSLRLISGVLAVINGNSGDASAVLDAEAG